MLTYDSIWMAFLDNYKVNDYDLPTSEERIYNDIRNAVRQYNNRMQAKLKCNDDIESVEGTSCEDDMHLIAQYIRLTYLNNQKVLLQSLYQPISQDVGIKNYTSQLNAIQNTITNAEDDIDLHIFYSRRSFL